MKGSVIKGNNSDILISDKTDVKACRIVRDRDGSYMMIKGALYWQNIIILSRPENIRSKNWQNWKEEVKSQL